MVNASGHGASGGASFGPTSSNSVTVTSEDAPSTATTTKGLVGINEGCATLRYSVLVHNSSTADEQLSLSALTDNSLGSITALTSPTPAFGQNGVVGTTCGVATGSPGLGTLSGSTGSGALPASLPVGGSDYSCQFDAQICGPGHTGVTGCAGIAGQHVNQVTGTLTGDEGEVVTQSANTLTVNTCTTSSTSSSP
jgi:hypothetical protein